MRYANLAWILVVTALLTATGAKAQDALLPEPKGPYAVGTTRLLLVDRSRPELFTADPDDFREIPVRVWYPADSAEGASVAPYYENAEDIVTRFGYPKSLLELETHSKFDIPVSEHRAAYPVIIFNHGWGEHAVQNTVLMEELASRGYVVVSLSHPYEAKFWVYPDRSLKFLDSWSSRFLKIMAEQNDKDAMPLFQAMFTTRGAAAQNSLFRRSVEAMPTLLGETPRMWADDIEFAAERLDSLNRVEGLFEGRLDVDKVGVMGMSMGGIAAGQPGTGDARFKAVMNIDGGLFGDLADTTVSRPTMFMGSRRFVGYDSVFADHVDGDCYVVAIGGADHYDFSDFTLLNRKHPMIGEVEGMTMLEIVNAYTLAFFDLYLKGVESELLTGERQPYAEVDFKAFREP
jgi:predicted dienelactone hydrolase